MGGIDYAVDEKDRRKAVVIDLAEHGALWDDFRQHLAADRHPPDPEDEEDLADSNRILRERLAHPLPGIPARKAVQSVSDELGRPLRQVAIHSHRSIYGADEPAKRVRILHVRHAAMRNAGAWELQGG